MAVEKSREQRRWPDIGEFRCVLSYKTCLPCADAGMKEHVYTAW